jgi:hypothetical protein
MRLFRGADEIELVVPTAEGDPGLPDGIDPEKCIAQLPRGRARAEALQQILDRAEAEYEEAEDVETAARRELSEGRLYVRYGCWYARETLSFPDERSAFQFLNSLPRECVSFCREIIATRRSHGLSLLSDQDILHRAAVRLLNGTLLVVVSSVVWSEIGSPEEGAAATSASDEPFAPPRPARPSEPRLAPPEPPTFDPLVDAAAMAEAKREAARAGVPFCEECMRAAAARSQSSPPPV